MGEQAVVRDAFAGCQPLQFLFQSAPYGNGTLVDVMQAPDA